MTVQISMIKNTKKKYKKKDKDSHFLVESLILIWNRKIEKEQTLQIYPNLGNRKKSFCLNERV